MLALSMNFISVLMIILLFALIGISAYILVMLRDCWNINKRILKGFTKQMNSALQIYDTGLEMISDVANRLENSKSRLLIAGNEVSAASRNLTTIAGELIGQTARLVEVVEGFLAGMSPAKQTVDLVRQFTDLVRQVRR